MARHKVLDACMICGGACECQKPAKKASTKTPKKRADKPEVDEITPIQKAGPALDTSIDVRAAMKAASEPVNTLNTLRPESYSPEFIDSLNNLHSVLHQEELTKYADILNRPKSRAAQWKARNGKPAS